jgi:hypothetical protein
MLVELALDREHTEVLPYNDGVWSECPGSQMPQVEAAPGPWYTWRDDWDGIGSMM